MCPCRPTRLRVVHHQRWWVHMRLAGARTLLMPPSPYTANGARQRLSNASSCSFLFPLTLTGLTLVRIWTRATIPISDLRMRIRRRVIHFECEFDGELSITNANSTESYPFRMRIRRRVINYDCEFDGELSILIPGLTANISSF